MNEVVKYHNDFSNKIILKNFTATELNFLMAICAKMRNQETNEVIFDFSQLRDFVKWDNNNNKLFIESLKNTNKKLLALNFEMPNEEAEYGGVTQFVLFPIFDVFPKTKKLKISVNKKFAYLLNGLSSNFTSFELENFTTLQSKYSKILYKELMKYKSTGYVIFKTEEFREKLDIPHKYRMTHINQKVLSPSKEELSKVFQKFEIKKIKKGREITHIEFYFSLKKEKIKEEIIEKIPQFRQTDITEVIKNMEEIKTEEKKKEKEQIIEVTEEEYESKYHEYLDGSNDTATQRRIFRNIVGKQYQIKKKKIYTIEDIPEEKLLSKNRKKLVGSALKMRVEKILKEMNQ